MGISGNQRAILTARFGAARFGATRFGFTPKATKGAFYVWKRKYLPTTTWKPKRRGNK